MNLFLDFGERILEYSFTALCMLEVISVATGSTALVLHLSGLALGWAADEHHFTSFSTCSVLDRAIISIKRVSLHA